MLTSLGARGDASRFAALGFAGYLIKPLRSTQTRECLELVLGQRNKAGLIGVADTTPVLVTRHTIQEAHRHRFRILLVEDNATNQLVLMKILEKLSYRAEAVDDGREALNILAEKDYDLILMDCQMPELDGFETTRVIRSGGAGVRKPNVPIIALTANALTGDREKCIEAGMDDYLTKPVDSSALAETLEKWLLLRKSTHGAQESLTELDNAEITPPEFNDTLPDFDYPSFLERMMNDEELARSLINTFLQDVPEQIDFLQSRIGEKDANASGRQAHKIKGSAGNMSALALAQVAGEMEAAGSKGDMGRIEDLFPELMRCAKRMSAAMGVYR
jgi:CheY-like chemotaxis protein/HPt (histidine-containing phosphotransfer) domain-containing protein